jgi:mannose-6-phosphate isomerase-like protein (cupin superfamily)
MKPWILLAAMIATPALAQAPPPATASAAAVDTPSLVYIPHDKVEAALGDKADLRLWMGKDLAVEGAFRNKPGIVEVHETLTNVFLITDGEATLVIGGVNEGGKPMRPGEIRGGTVTGGTAYHVVKGDVFVIRPGVPTWFKEVPKTVSYFVVKSYAK